jgi:hypothetical protein
MLCINFIIIVFVIMIVAFVMMVIHPACLLSGMPGGDESAYQDI